MSIKQFKDPIYGYIEIDSNLVTDIIDTPTFQRLKDIRQTSYTPLYPAAYHNRYIHSLGVYHLGQMAFSAIKSQLENEAPNEEFRENIDHIEHIFELACLLHDIGHAPFSHTGETFYLDKKETLYSKLKETVDCPNFTSDFDALATKKPAEHECMSCIVGLKTFSNFFNSTEDRSLFARCIIGMPTKFRETAPNYKQEDKSEKRQAVAEYEEYNRRRKSVELQNCIIELLNSSIIDVDRLDYIIRDATTIGFKNAQVDYYRLLKGLRILKQKIPEAKYTYHIGYHKSALSVIESAIYAHDAEKKWIQSHPAILYEMVALKSAMAKLTGLFTTTEDKNPLFCYESLTEAGKRLFWDEPLLSQEANELLKNNCLLTPQAQALLENGALLCDGYAYNKSTYCFREHIDISLLADEDILHLMKRFCKDELSFEYFARNKRRHAVWKSEAEFRALFDAKVGDASKTSQKLERDFESLADYCQQKTGVPIVNEQIFTILEEERQNAEIAQQNQEIPDDEYDDIIAGLDSKKQWANFLKEKASELKIEFDFLIIFQKKFSSSFKSSIGDILIEFPNVGDGVFKLNNVIDTLQTDSKRKSNFFHIFYKPLPDSVSKKEIVNGIADGLIQKASLM